jgi:hypothetical protein
MRILLIDHGCCDPPATRVHACREQLERLGAVPLACGPASVPSIEAQVPGLHGIHLHAIAAASRVFLGAIHDGSPAAFLSATAAISPRLLGSVRETARQAIAEAVDAFDPDAIFVLHAGILADLAIETGVPVALHVGMGDLAVAEGAGRIGDLVAAALGSAETVAAEDEATAATIVRDWLDHDDAASRPQVAVFAAGPDRAAEILAACEQALARRRG